MVMACCAVCSTGCQANRWLNQTALPVPEPVLDADALQNIRYQSPGAGASGPAGILNKASHRMGTVTDRVVEDNVDQSQLVSNVQFKGNQTIPVHKLRRNISTRPGRYFDPVKLQQDVTKLWQMPEVASVNGPYIDRSPAGVSVTFDIVEQTKLNVVEFIGNRAVSDKLLLKESGLVDQTHFDAYQIRTSRKRIEELYRDKGYPRTQVEIIEGDKASDSKVVFLIHEDEQQKIWKVEFEGNTIASDGRLKSFVKGKPGIAKVIGGLARRDVIEEDIVRLESYYRSLGFFNARIGREIEESNDGRWLSIRFIINEGPRYRVRNVSYVGNQVYPSPELDKLVELRPGQEMPEFNVAKMNQDVVALRDLYSSQGYVYATVEAEPRFLEEPGMLDLVYRIDEGEQYRVGKVNVHYEGDYGITKREVVLNRFRLHPGDLIDSREIRRTERDLGSAQIFATGQQTGGSPPKVVVRPKEKNSLSRTANSNSSFGGSSSGGSGSRNR